MAQDPKNDQRRKVAEQGAPSPEPPDQGDALELDEDKAAKALNQIEEVRRKLEPRG